MSLPGSVCADSFSPARKGGRLFFPEPPFLPGCRWTLISIRSFTGVAGERLWDTLLENRIAFAIWLASFLAGCRRLPAAHSPVLATTPGGTDSGICEAQGHGFLTGCCRVVQSLRPSPGTIEGDRRIAWISFNVVRFQVMAC